MTQEASYQLWLASVDAQQSQEGNLHAGIIKELFRVNLQSMVKSMEMPCGNYLPDYGVHPILEQYPRLFREFENLTFIAVCEAWEGRPRHQSQTYHILVKSFFFQNHKNCGI